MQQPVWIRALTLASLCACVPTLLAQQQSLATNATKPLSTRVVDYTIDAHIDTAHKALDATETLTYRNLTGQPLTSIPFHLYLNAFQPESTFTSETHFGGGIRDSESGNEYPERKKGSIILAQIDADGFGPLLNTLRFTAPDDGNANDRTVATIALPHPLVQGDAITFHIRFHDQFPESVARNGYKRDFLMGGQWFPKIGVFWHGRWNCHQYHATTEFFSDFGTYRVRLTLPKNYVVGASGVPTGDQLNPDGTQTLSFYGEDIGDFAWAASPHFQLTTGTFLSSLGPVQVRVLALASHPDAGPRYLKILLQSLDQFDRRYGPYPYKILTMIDPEPGSEIGGMEYPTLITGDTSWFDPSHITEVVTEHEFGHQYWYGMVATNEFEDAWLDEGINSYTELNVTDAILGKRTSAIDKPWFNASDTAEQYLSYLGEADYDPVVRHAWQFVNAGSYGRVTYGKSALLLKTLEGIVGRDTMDEAMRVYFMRYRFTHPTTEDFLRTIEEVAVRRGRATGALPPVTPAASFTLPGTAITLISPPAPGIYVPSSLRPYFNQAVYGTRLLDYAIEDLQSGPATWWLPESKQPIRSTFVVHRLGDFVLPVVIQVVFSDGTRLRELWTPDATEGPDTNTRWKRFNYTRNAKIVSAELDPDHTVLLDADHFNDSYTIVPNPVPARKLANLWMSTLEAVQQCAGWLV